MEARWSCDTDMSIEIYDFGVKGRLGVEENLSRQKVWLVRCENPVLAFKDWST